VARPVTLRDLILALVLVAIVVVAFGPRHGRPAHAILADTTRGRPAFSTRT
jgi:hypothetical protein